LFLSAYESLGNMIFQTGGSHMNNRTLLISKTGTVTLQRNQESMLVATPSNNVAITTNFSVSGVSTFSDNVRIIDNKSLLIGDHASGDLSFVHDGNNSVIRNRTGDLYVSNASQTYFHLVGSTGAVKAHHGNNLKFETTNTGITVTGTAVATSFTGDLTGDVTGDVTGTASNATLAVSAQGLTGSPNITVTDVNAVDAIISGNLSVAGTITSLDQNDILATGIITASSGVDLGDPGIVTLSSDTLTTTSTSADTISSISATVFRSATFQVQVTRGTQYHMTTINVIHNGTVAFMSEYGTIRTGAVLATFDADINSGNLRLRATPTSADSTVFKLSKTTIKV